MNVALIFAGGVGSRMNLQKKLKPKQFLQIHNKAIIIHTIEHFENHNEIDAIAVVCLGEWLEYLQQLISKANLKKVRWLVKGGPTALESQLLGLTAIDKELSQRNQDCIVLIHDGVRPLIDAQTISRCIESVKEFGSAITTSSAIETIVTTDNDGNIVATIQRDQCLLARAPQAFYLKEILYAHEKAKLNGENSYIDSASLMLACGKILHTVVGPAENIKVTTPSDYYTCKGLLDARENEQIYGL